MPTDPLTGARYPASNASPAAYQDIQNAVNDLSDIIGGIFTTNSARNTAFANWVAQGNTMRDGLTCRVAGMPQVYRSGSWRGVGALTYGTTTADSTVYVVSHDVMTQSIPDPTWPYQLHAQGSVLLSQVGTGVQVGAQIAINGTLINPLGAPVGNGAGQRVGTDGAALTDPMTGAATVTLRIVVLVSGAPNFGFQCAASDARNKLSVLVIPA